MNKIFITLLLGMFMISFASSISELDDIIAGECVDLYQYCDDCTYVNLTTISYPNGQIDTSLNEEMTKINQNFNYTFCNTSETGSYFYIVCGDKNTKYKCEEIKFEVTPSGKSGSSNIIFYIIILVLGYVLNLMGFFKQNAVITILGGIILVFTGLYMIANGIIIYRDNLTLAISYITLFWGAGSSLWAAVESLD